MFSVDYSHKSVFISAYNIRRIDFRNQIKLQKLIVRALKNSCEQIVVNLVGVRQMDTSTMNMLKLMAGITRSLGINFILMNLDNELSTKIKKSYTDIALCLASPVETFFLAEKIN